MSGNPPPPHPGVPNEKTTRGQPLPSGATAPVRTDLPPEGPPPAYEASYHHVPGPEGDTCPPCEGALSLPERDPPCPPYAQEVVFGREPVSLVCPHCQQTVVTRVRCQPGFVNTLLCLLCCFAELYACCFIPCLIDDLSDMNHSCPICRGHIITI